MSLRVGAGLEQPARGDPAEAPQVLVELGVVEVGPDRERILVGVRLEPARDRAQRLRVGRDPAEPAGEALVPRRALDRVVLAREVVEREADRDGLEVVRLGLVRRVRLAGPARDSKPVTCSAPASGSRPPVSVASRNQAAETTTSPVRPAQRDRVDPVAVDVGRDGGVAEQHGQPPVGERGASIASMTASDTRGSCPAATPCTRRG